MNISWGFLGSSCLFQGSRALRNSPVFWTLPEAIQEGKLLSGTEMYVHNNETVALQSNCWGNNKTDLTIAVHWCSEMQYRWRIHAWGWMRQIFWIRLNAAHGNAWDLRRTPNNLVTSSQQENILITLLEWKKCITVPQWTPPYLPR